MKESDDLSQELHDDGDDYVVGTPDEQQQQLPFFWPNEVRGVPNVTLRGALFSINQEREIYRRRQRIPSVDGYEIMLKGERFNQKDLDLWEMLLHLGRKQATDYVRFTASELLKALGRSTGGSDYDELKEDVARLMSTYVEINCMKSGLTFAGHLVANMERHEATQQYAIFFDEKMRSLFDDGFSHVDWELRRKLRSNALAQWLHGFYTTHASAHPYKVATLKTLCGSKAARMTDFRKAMRVALHKMESVGAIIQGSIDPETDLVKLRRRVSPSQARHLARRQAEQGSRIFSDNSVLPFDTDKPF